MRLSFFSSLVVVASSAIACVGWHSGEAGGFPKLSAAEHPRRVVLFVHDGALEPLAVQDPMFGVADSAAVKACEVRRCSQSVPHAESRVLPIDVGRDAREAISDGLTREKLFALSDDAQTYRLRLALADGFAMSKSDAKLVSTSLLTAGVFPFVEQHPLTITATLESPSGAVIATHTLHEDYTVMMELLTLPALPFGATTPSTDAKGLWREVGVDVARWAAFEVDRYERFTTNGR